MNILNLIAVNLENLLMRNSINLFGIEVKFYGIIIATSMLIAIFMARRLAIKRNINPDEIYVLALFVLPFSILGARSYYCIFSESSYSFSEFFNIRSGGLAIYGGVIGGILGIIIFALIKKDIKLTLRIFDICAPCLILGQTLGRWGNFFNQEAYGNLVANEKLQWFPYAVFIEGENAWFQATFFYESLWNLVGLFILLMVFKKSESIGTTTASYLVWYGVGRTIIEGLRSDSLYIGSTGIRVSQLLSVLMVVAGTIILVFNFIKKRKLNGQEK